MISSEKVVDRYRIQMNQKLGEGSFGKVYVAIDTGNENKVAMKILEKQVINSDSYLRQSLMNEIKIMKKLKGKNVVRLLDVLETSNNYYIVQEFCDSGDLRKYLMKHRILPEPEAKQILIDILLGFIELLRKGVIHRDLKPANILIDKGSFKLADFGFAKNLQNFSQELLQSNVGTPLYMSPQILEKKRYKSKSDIWSLGFLYYECLFGQTPWFGNSPSDLLKNIKNQPLEFNSVPISSQSQDFLRRCLTYSEEDRISWDQVYKHPLFDNCFQSFLEEEKRIENRANFIVNEIRTMVAAQKIDIMDSFNQHSQNNQLSISDLGQLFKSIQIDMTREETEYLFNIFDGDNSGYIDSNEFKRWLEKNQVKLTPHKPEEVEVGTPELKPRRHSSLDNAKVILLQLQNKIREKELSLANLFKQLDKDQNFLIDLGEFSDLVLKIEPNANEEEIKQLFGIFDRDKNGSIDFQEFKAAIFTPAHQTEKPSVFQL